MSRMVTSKISDDTPILPEVVADMVVGEVTAYFYYFMTEDQGTDSDPELFKEVNSLNSRKLVNELYKQAEVVYASNKSFAKKIKAKGNKGRDALYSFMRHWLAALLKKKHPLIYKKIPRSFDTGTKIDEYYGR